MSSNDGVVSQAGRRIAALNDSLSEGRFFILCYLCSPLLRGGNVISRLRPAARRRSSLSWQQGKREWTARNRKQQQKNSGGDSGEWLL